MSKFSPSLILEDFVSLFFPTCCAACDDSLVRGEKLICSRCLVELPRTNYHLDFDNPLRLRLQGRIPLENALAFLKFTKSGKTQNLLHSLKYKGNADIGVALGKLFAQKLKDADFNFCIDGIIPVPLHATRQRQRGYNQSVKFAEGISSIMHIPVYEHAVFRKSKTETQTKKNKIDRWENVSDVFAIRDPNLITNRHLLVVDDVITTGATIEALVTTLLSAGPAKVSLASIAVA